MQITLGAVYKDEAGVSFVATIDTISGGNQTVSVRLVNVTNWISLGHRDGKQLVSGRIDCPSLSADQIEMIATSLSAYYLGR